MGDVEIILVDGGSRDHTPHLAAEHGAAVIALATHCVVDPALVVEHDHTHDSLRSIYRRARREAEGYAAFLDDPPGPATPATLAHAWWSDTRWYDSAARARLSHRRAARLYGAYAGRRQGAASSSSSGVPRA